MSLKGSAHVEHKNSDEIQQQRRTVQQMIEDSQVTLLDAIRSMLVERTTAGRSPAALRASLL